MLLPQDLKHHLTPVGVFPRSAESSMPGKRIALVVVVAAAATIIALKASSPDGAGSPGAAQPAASSVPSAGRPAVVLVADLREADSDCGCGQIIRRVRAAKAKGVVVEELAPDSAEAGRRYGVTVAPTVVFVGPSGEVIARREGESNEVLAAVSQDLAKLEGAVR